MPTWTPNNERFKELLLYVSAKCAPLPTFGATKLNKVLFYADFLAYAFIGSSITGFEYQKLENGPAPRGIMGIREQMEKAGDVVVKVVLISDGRKQHRVVAKRPANMQLFTKEELEIVDGVITALQDANAERVSELSHIEVGWKVARLHETIPYGTIFLSDKPLTEEETKRIQSFAEEHGYAAR